MARTGIDLATYRVLVGLWTSSVGGRYRRFRSSEATCPRHCSIFHILYLFLLLRSSALPHHGDVQRNPGPAVTVATVGWSDSNLKCASRTTSARLSSLLLTNTRSLLLKLSELRHLLDSTKPVPDVVAVTETWLSSSIPDSTVCNPLPGYSVLRRDRKADRMGGGVAVLVRDGVCSRRRCDLELWPEEVWIEFPGRCKSLLLGCVYRPPSPDVSEYLSSLDTTLHLVDPEREEVLLVGDFNATSPTWLPSDAYNAAGAALEPAFLQLGLTQHVDLSTHL